MKYLFDDWGVVKAALYNKRLFLFLDFDGTLAPIAQRPEQAVLPGKTRQILSRLAHDKDFDLAFISGRSLEDIKDKIGLRNVIYAGNHGLEIEDQKLRFTPIVSLRYADALKAIKGELEKGIISIQGAFVEDKGLAVCLHYRLVGNKKVALVKSAFREIVNEYLQKGLIRVKSGKKVLEVVPPSAFNKGKIVLWFLARQYFKRGADELFPVYIGDDKTDEDAFSALKNKGLTVSVGKKTASAASYYVKDTQEVCIFLEKLLQLKKTAHG